MFCGADEDTGKTMIDTCDLTGSQICFHGMIGRYQRNTSLLSSRKIKSDCHLASGKMSLTFVLIYSSNTRSPST